MGRGLQQTPLRTLVHPLIWNEKLNFCCFLSCLIASILLEPLKKEGRNWAPKICYFSSCKASFHNFCTPSKVRPNLNFTKFSDMEKGIDPRTLSKKYFGTLANFWIVKDHLLSSGKESFSSLTLNIWHPCSLWISKLILVNCKNFEISICRNFNCWQKVSNNWNTFSMPSFEVSMSKPPQRCS